MKDKELEPNPREWETTTKECEPKIETNPNVTKIEKCNYAKQ